jgi:hypothetical protein
MVEVAQVIRIRVVAKEGRKDDISMGRISLALGTRSSEALVGEYM